MNSYPKKFINTKNIPQSEAKFVNKQNLPTYSASDDRPFSKPYEAPEDFDYLTLLNGRQNYPFSLNPKNIFPRNNCYNEDSKNVQIFETLSKWALQHPKIPEFQPEMDLVPYDMTEPLSLDLDEEQQF